MESNPGPPKVQPGPSRTAPSETIRTFTRYLQSILVRLIYEANKVKIPKALYKQSPPGWDSSDGIEFKSICNVSKGGNEIFDKLIKLCKRDVKKIPKDILDVILCYEKLRDSAGENIKETEREKWKTALENFMSQSKFKKNKQTILQNLSKENIINVLQKATELVKQGAICSTDDDIYELISVYQDFGDALMEQRGGNLVNFTILQLFTNTA